MYNQRKETKMLLETLLTLLVSLLYTVAAISLETMSLRLYHALPRCTVTGEWFSINGFDNAILCCAECTKRTNCTAVNYNQAKSRCELIYPGDTQMTLANNADWALYYTDIHQIDRNLNATATQSSTLRDFFFSHEYVFHAFYAIDGNYDSYIWALPGGCAHTDVGQDEWWMVDVRVTLPVQGVSIVNRQDCCPERLSNLRLTVSETLSAVDDDDNGCATYRGPPNPLSLNPVTIKCMRTMAGRYVKIVKQDSDGELTLCEVDLIV